MKKFFSIMIVVMLLTGLVLNSSATVPTLEYVESSTQISTLPNETIPQSAPVLPQTGGIPMFAFMGTGVLLIVIAVVISGKKQKIAK